MTPSNCVQCGAITAKGGASDTAGGRRRTRLQAHLAWSSCADVEAARKAIGGRLHRTPTFTSATLSERTGGRVSLKAELFQRTGSFKPRGVLTNLAALTPRSASAA